MSRGLNVQGLLKSLCRNNGWSYAVLWCFDHRNSSMLTMRDAYNEDQVGILIDNMLLQVHTIGTGIVGQTVSSMRNRWVFSDDDCMGQCSMGFNNQGVLEHDQDDIHWQFSCGIKTIAFIPLEMQGVLQFGSTQKIYETREFVCQAKQLLRMNEATNMATGFSLLDKTCSNISSSHSDIFNEGFSSSTKEDFFCFGSAGSFHSEANQFSHFVSSSNLFGLLSSSAVPTPESSIINQPTAYINQEHSLQEYSNLSIDTFDGLTDLVMPLNIENCLDFGDNLGFLSNQSMNFMFRDIDQDFSDPVVICKEESSLATKTQGESIGSSRTVNCNLPPKKSTEKPLRNIKKRAKPGTRPKPKDRVQIRERIAELRKLIPNGGKRSIDSLLAQTVNHMLFLEGITKHAESMKLANDQKDRQSMTEPVFVKELNAHGQMMIEIHFDETECFSDIIEIIRGFNLTILKGNMQTKGNKFRACFVVQAEMNRRFTKQHLYISLHTLFNQKDSSSNMNATEDWLSGLLY